MRDTPIARTWVAIITKPTTNAVAAPEGESLRDLAPFTLRYKAKVNGRMGSVVHDMAAERDAVRACRYAWR